MCVYVPLIFTAVDDEVGRAVDADQQMGQTDQQTFHSIQTKFILKWTKTLWPINRHLFILVSSLLALKALYTWIYSNKDYPVFCAYLSYNVEFKKRAHFS